MSLFQNRVKTNFLKEISSFSVDGLKCYTDVEGTQITTCKETEGYRTCFTKYNDSKNTNISFMYRTYAGKIRRQCLSLNPTEVKVFGQTIFGHLSGCCALLLFCLLRLGKKGVCLCGIYRTTTVRACGPSSSAELSALLLLLLQPSLSLLLFWKSPLLRWA